MFISHTHFYKRHSTVHLHKGLFSFCHCQAIHLFLTWWELGVFHFLLCGICTYVTSCVYRTDTDVMCLPLPPPNFFETGSIIQPGAHQLAQSAARWASGIPLSPACLTHHTQPLHRCLVSELTFQCSHDKHFDLRVISPARLSFSITQHDRHKI